MDFTLIMHTPQRSKLWLEKSANWGAVFSPRLSTDQHYAQTDARSLWLIVAKTKFWDAQKCVNCSSAEAFNFGMWRISIEVKSKLTTITTHFFVLLAIDKDDGIVGIPLFDDNIVTHHVHLPHFAEANRFTESTHSLTPRTWSMSVFHNKLPTDFCGYSALATSSSNSRHRDLCPMSTSSRWRSIEPKLSRSSCLHIGNPSLE